MGRDGRKNAAIFEWPGTIENLQCNRGVAPGRFALPDDGWVGLALINGSGSETAF